MALRQHQPMAERGLSRIVSPPNLKGQRCRALPHTDPGLPPRLSSPAPGEGEGHGDGEPFPWGGSPGGMAAPARLGPSAGGTGSPAACGGAVASGGRRRRVTPEGTRAAAARGPPARASPPPRARVRPRLGGPPRRAPVGSPERLGEPVPPESAGHHPGSHR